MSPADPIPARKRGSDMTANKGVPQLSPQEGLVLEWWLKSMTKASVARRMGISAHTVDMYIRRIRGKYAQAGRPVPTKADLLLRAIEDGLYVP